MSQLENKPSEISAKRAKAHTYRLYYESKIKCLENTRLSPALHLLACKDAPFEAAGLDSSWQRNRYIKKCLRYYKKKLTELEKELKKL